MKYSIKVWLFTIIVSPLVVFLIFHVIDFFNNYVKFDQILKWLGVIILMILYGIVWSIPAMFIFWLIQRIILKNCSHLKTKIILSFYSFFSVWATFYIFERGFAGKNLNQILIALIYSLIIVSAVWIFKLPFKANRNAV